MIALVILTAAVVILLVLTCYLLGYRLGGQSQRDELQRLWLESRRASRDMAELTKAAFVAMAEEAERQRRGR